MVLDGMIVVHGHGLSYKLLYWKSMFNRFFFMRNFPLRELFLLFGHTGMDAQVAYGFHHLRNEKPYLAQGPISNKV